MPDLVSYGVIGCGMMGQEHLRNIALLPGARVAAIFEPDPGMQRAALAAAPGAQSAASIEALLGHDGLDCLLIASPNHLHAAQFEAIAARRPLPILIEKPLFTRPDEAPRLAAVGAGYGAPVWVGMEYRYMPAIRAFIDGAGAATGGVRMLTIREHRFPFLRKVGDWNRFNRNTGGTLVEKCCHFFDLMRLILGAEPVRVMASAGQDVNHKDEVYGGEAPDIWDGAYVIVDFDNGARAMLELCMYAEGSTYQEELVALGAGGKIEARVPGPARFWPARLGPLPAEEVIVSPRDPKGPRRIEVALDPRLEFAGDHHGATYYLHEAFLRTVRDGVAPEVSLADGLRAVEIGLAAQRSALSGESVALARPMPLGGGPVS